MTIRSILTPIIAGAMLAAPVAAEAANRAPTPVQQSEGVEGQSTWIWVGLGVAALVVLIIIIADDNNNDNPMSP